MKKVLLVSAFAVLALASCKKDYVCDCGILGSSDYNGLKKSEADDARITCESNTLGVCKFKEK